MRRAAIALVLICTAVLSAGALATAGGFAPFLTSWGTAGTTPGAFRGPDQITVDVRGQVYIADRVNDRVQKFDYRGHLLAVIGSSGKGRGQFSGPRGVATDGLGDLYVADSANHRIQKFDAAGRILAVWGHNGGDGSAGTMPREFNDPRGIATDAAGDLYVADHGNNRVQVFDPQGRFLRRWGHNGGDGTAGVGDGEFHNPRGLAVDRAGNVYVADKVNSRIQVFDAQGRFLRRFGRNGGDGSAGSASGELRIPYSVAVAPSGELYVADTGNNRLQEFTPAGAFLQRLGHNGGDGSAGAGPSEFSTPYGVAVDCRGGLYVTDEGNNRVQTFGQPGLAPPACPPRLRLGRLLSPARGSLSLTASCDQPCVLSIRASFRSHGRVRRVVEQRSLGLGAASATLRIALPRSLRRISPRGVATRIQVLASGFGGRSPPVRRERRLR